MPSSLLLQQVPKAWHPTSEQSVSVWNMIWHPFSAQPFSVPESKLPSRYWQATPITADSEESGVPEHLYTVYTSNDIEHGSMRTAQVLRIAVARDRSSISANKEVGVVAESLQKMRVPTITARKSQTMTTTMRPSLRSQCTISTQTQAAIPVSDLIPGLWLWQTGPNFVKPPKN